MVFREARQARPDQQQSAFGTETDSNRPKTQGPKEGRVRRLVQFPTAQILMDIIHQTRSKNLELNSTRYDAHCLGSDRPKTDEQTCLTDDFGLILTDDSPVA